MIRLLSRECVDASTASLSFSDDAVSASLSQTHPSPVYIERSVALTSIFLRNILEDEPAANGGYVTIPIAMLAHKELTLAATYMTRMTEAPPPPEPFELPDLVDPTDLNQEAPHRGGNKRGVASVSGGHHHHHPSLVDALSVDELMMLFRAADFLDVPALWASCFERTVRLCQRRCTEREYSQLLGHPDYYVCGRQVRHDGVWKSSPGVGGLSPLDTLPSQIIGEIGKHLTYEEHGQLARHCPSLETKFGLELLYATGKMFPTQRMVSIDAQMLRFPRTRTIVVDGNAELDAWENYPHTVYDEVTRLEIDFVVVPTAEDIERVLVVWSRRCPNTEVLNLLLNGTFLGHQDWFVVVLRSIQGMEGLRHLSLHCQSAPTLWTTRVPTQALSHHPTLRSFGGDVIRLVGTGLGDMVDDHGNMHLCGLQYPARLQPTPNGLRAKPYGGGRFYFEDYLTRPDRYTAPAIATATLAPACRLLREAITCHGVDAVVDACRRDAVARRRVFAVLRQAVEKGGTIDSDVATLLQQPLFRHIPLKMDVTTIKKSLMDTPCDTVYEYVYKGRLHQSTVAFHALSANKDSGDSDLFTPISGANAAVSRILGNSSSASGGRDDIKMYIRIIEATEAYEGETLHQLLRKADSHGMTTLMWLSAAWKFTPYPLEADVSASLQFASQTVSSFQLVATTDTNGNTALHHLAQSGAYKPWLSLASCFRHHLLQPNKLGQTPFSLDLVHAYRADDVPHSLLRMEDVPMDLDMLSWLLGPCEVEPEWGVGPRGKPRSQALLADIGSFCAALYHARRCHTAEEMCTWRNTNGDNLMHRLFYGLQHQGIDTTVTKIVMFAYLPEILRLAKQRNNAGFTPVDLLEKVWWFNSTEWLQHCRRRLCHLSGCGPGWTFAEAEKILQVVYDGYMYNSLKSMLGVFHKGVKANGAETKFLQKFFSDMHRSDDGNMLRRYPPPW